MTDFTFDLGVAIEFVEQRERRKVAIVHLVRPNIVINSVAEAPGRDQPLAEGVINPKNDVAREITGDPRRGDFVGQRGGC